MIDAPLAPRCGIIVHRRGDRAEDLLAAVVDRLRDRPLRVGGMYQVTEVVPNGSNVMTVIDIASRRRIRISQNLGQGSESCCLDPAGLAEAAGLLRRAIDDRVDLLIANKFAGSEIEGRGLAPDIFEALSEGIPVLTLVSDRYLDGWRALAGDIGDVLEPTMDAVEGWVDGLTPQTADEEERT